MAALDDLPLDPGRGALTEPSPSAPSSPGPRLVLAGVALLVLVLAAGIWYSRSQQRAADAQAAATAQAAAAAAAETVADTPPVPADLPPLGAMDPYVRELFATLGAHPELLKWLATDDLVGSLVTAVDRLAQGHSPARDLAVLRPTQGFAVTRRGDVTQIDPASHARFSAVVAAATTVNPATLAAAYATLRPRLEEAYVAQGHPEGGFDQALRKAVDVVATTPDVPADAALVPGVGGYAYADPAYEKLPPAQKHLVRMGPEQVRRVREAARQFGAALPPPATTR